MLPVSFVSPSSSPPQQFHPRLLTWFSQCYISLCSLLRTIPTIPLITTLKFAAKVDSTVSVDC